MRRYVFFMLTISLWFTTKLAGGQERVLRPESFLGADIKIARNLSTVEAPLFPSSPSGLLDTLSWRTLDSTNVMFGFLTYGDTGAIWFEPLADCSLKAMRLYSSNFEGNVHIGVWKTRYDGHIITKDSVDINGWMGMFEGDQWIAGPTLGYSPLGNLIWGPAPLTITEDMNNSWVEISTDLLGEPNLGSDPFVVGMTIYLQKGWGFGAEMEAAVPYHFFKYYTEGVGPDQVHPGWYIRSMSLWMEAVVKYYSNTPPEISRMDQLAWTYSLGPYAVQAQIMDKDYENPSRAGIASTYLHWIVRGLEDSTIMEGPRNGGIFTGLIPQREQGDTVWYYVSAIDDLDKRSVNTPLSFARLGPVNPLADILLVDQGYGDEDFYTQLLDSLGYEYETWDMYKRHGIDRSVTDCGWSTVILFSGWTSSVPTREHTGNVWSEFLERGGNERPANLLYIDRNYFLWNKEPDEPVFSPGDFAYDYLGLLSGADDPYEFDYELWGLPGDPISGDFADSSLEQRWYPDYQYNWVGYARARTGAVDIFFTEDDSGSGVRYDTGRFKTVFLPWYFEELLEDTGTDTVPAKDAHFLMANVLQWFGTQRQTEVTDHPNEISPQDIVLYQNYPNPFNPETKIAFILAEPSYIRLLVHNILGQEVRVLVDGYVDGGYHTVQWDSRNEQGDTVPAGVYLYRLETNQFSDTKRMILLK
jgi:hypothetical protein